MKAILSRFRGPISAVAFGLSIFVSVSSHAARIELNDGSIILGEVVGLNSGNYTIRMSTGQNITIPASAVKGINSSGAPTTGGSASSSMTPTKSPIASSTPSLVKANALQFSGSNTIGEKLAPALVVDYLKSKGATVTGPTTTGANEVSIGSKGTPPDVSGQAEIKAHGSGTAFKALATHVADIGMSSRPILQKEAVELASLGDMTGPASEHVLALDGLAIIVHPGNPVASLSKDQIARIFSCEIKDWGAVGGQPGPITLFARDEKSGTFDTFKHIVLGDTKLCDIPTTNRIESSDELSSKVAKTPGAIGFIGFAYIGSARPVTISECRLAYPATPFTVKTEEYPLSRRLFLYTPEQHPTEVDDFLRYTRSESGQKVVEKNGFIDLAIVPDEDKTQAVRRLAALPALGRLKTVEEFVTVTNNATRLSVTFRFRTGSADLDNRAIHDIERLAAYIKGPSGKGRKLMLMGFTDSDGKYDSNLSLSKQRAHAISELLIKRGVSVSYVGGFGPEAPIACNESASGKEKNRHVEVWIQ